MSIDRLGRAAVVSVVLTVLALASTTGCRKKTPAEKFGDKIENAGDKIEDKVDEAN